MREDVGLTGNALNRIVMFWTLFYVIGQIPMIMLQSVSTIGLWVWTFLIAFSPYPATKAVSRCCESSLEP